MIHFSATNDRLGLDTNALSWLTPHLSAPWQWDDGGAALQWEDGGTVCFAEELAIIADRFGERRLPPLTAILYLLAAVKWQTLETLPAAIRDQLCVTLAPILDLVKTTAAKHLLVELMLDGQIQDHAPAGASVARLIRMGWRPGVDDSLLSLQDTQFSHEFIVRALASVDTRRLRLQLETGLADLPAPAEDLPDPAGFSPTAFLEALERDVETAGIARLTRDIMAALTLPQMMHRSEDGAAGGVADISNRGPLHRLMLSELAHDDDTLAARVAMNEALYLQPEPPARKPPGALVLLLDCGLRLWGLPRVFATSAALALCLKARPQRAAIALRAHGINWIEANLASPDGLKKHLTVLETSYDLMPALPTLPALLENLPAGRDVVLCVHECTLSGPAFAQSLAAHLGAFTPLHIVAVDGEGRISLHQFSLQGMRLLHQAQLKLDKLFAKRDGRRAKQGSLQSLASWPAIFGRKHLPFLIAPASAPFAVVRMESPSVSGVFGLNKRKEIWFKRSGHSGARRIAIPALRGKLLAFQVNPGVPTRVVACSWDQASERLDLAVITPEVTCEDGPVPYWVVPGFAAKPDDLWFDNDCLIVLCGRTLRGIRLANGEELPECEVPQQFTHKCGRFFSAALANRPQIYKCELLGGEFELGSTGGEPIGVAPVFVFPGKEGIPMFVNWDGSISPWDNSSGKTDPLPSGKRVVRAKASADGLRVWMKVHPDGFYLRDLGSGRMLSMAPDQSEWPFFVQNDVFVNWSMRTHIDAIALGADGSVAICGASGAWLYVTKTGNSFRLRPRVGETRLATRSFEHTTWSDEHFCTVRTAEWTNGSRAFFDGRGLLHLQSISSHIPEVSLSLPNEMALSAWSSDGHLVGSSSETGVSSDAATHASAIAGHIKCFVMEILQ